MAQLQCWKRHVGRILSFLRTHHSVALGDACCVNLFDVLSKLAFLQALWKPAWHPIKTIYFNNRLSANNSNRVTFCHVGWLAVHQHQKALWHKICLAGPSGDSGGDGPLTHGPAGGSQLCGRCLWSNDGRNPAVGEMWDREGHTDCCYFLKFCNVYRPKFYTIVLVVLVCYRWMEHRCADMWHWLPSTYIVADVKTNLLCRSIVKCMRVQRTTPRLNWPLAQMCLQQKDRLKNVGRCEWVGFLLWWSCLMTMTTC